MSTIARNFGSAVREYGAQAKDYAAEAASNTLDYLNQTVGDPSTLVPTTAAVLTFAATKRIANSQLATRFCNAASAYLTKADKPASKEVRHPAEATLSGLDALNTLQRQVKNPETTFTKAERQALAAFNEDLAALAQGQDATTLGTITGLKSINENDDGDIALGAQITEEQFDQLVTIFGKCYVKQLPSEFTADSIRQPAALNLVRTLVTNEKDRELEAQRTYWDKAKSTLGPLASAAATRASNTAQSSWAYTKDKAHAATVRLAPYAPSRSTIAAGVFSGVAYVASAYAMREEETQ